MSSGLCRRIPQREWEDVRFKETGVRRKENSEGDETVKKHCCLLDVDGDQLVG